MQFNRVIVFAALLVAALSLASCGGGDESSKAGDGASAKSAGKKVIMKAASVLPAEHPSSQALEFMKKRLGELSGGSMEVRLFLNSQLGDATESVESCQNGNTEMVFASVAPLSQFVPELNALSMPFIFRDKAHEYAVVDGPIGERLSKKLEPVGLHNLCYFDAGSRNLMTKKGPINRPEDLKGMKIRVMPSKVMIDTINALGASAVAMGQGEVYGALQTGVLDGWENNAPTCLSFKMHETGCIYYAATRHLAVPDLLLVNKGFYDKLTPEQRGFLDQAAKETVAKQRELWKADETKAIEELKAKGMKFNDVDVGIFAERAKSVYEEAHQKYGEEFQEICVAIKSQP